MATASGELANNLLTAPLLFHNLQSLRGTGIGIHQAGGLYLLLANQNRCYGGALQMADIQIRDLVEVIAKALAEHPEDINVTEISGQQISVIELRAAKDDLGKIIGREGRNADALRVLVNATATKLRKRAVLEILE